jgi:hypothetical protein
MRQLLSVDQAREYLRQGFRNNFFRTYRIYPEELHMNVDTLRERMRERELLRQEQERQERQRQQELLRQEQERERQRVLTRQKLEKRARQRRELRKQKAIKKLYNQWRHEDSNLPALSLPSHGPLRMPSNT